ncbi:MAG: beta-ketoacyl-ACP synthase II [Bacteroidetes bacterium]|nr:MAG: beta-ketoacyl-ACP synthase II [Bacteroidota bacterium]
MRRVVVTGMGAITPLGNNVEAFFDALKNGKSGAAPITRFDTEKFKTRFACEVKGFDPLEYLEKAEVRKYDLFVQYALGAVHQALKQSGIKDSELDYTRAGVIWGSGNGGFTTFEEQVSEFAKSDGTPRFNPYFILKTIPNMASGAISIKHGFKGINYTVITACAASNSAFMDAFNYIRWGKADVIISGGSEAAITPAAIGGFSSIKALSTRNDDPVTASRPFDSQRDGFVLGEGAGALVLEEYEHAIKRGAPIFAELVGAAMTADAYHMSATHPEGEGAYTAMKLALEDARLQTTDIDYINAHATSTEIGDLSEVNAIHRLFGNNPNLVVSATKSMTGHLLGGAGAIEAIASIQAIRTGIVPATMGVTEIDPAIPKDLNIITQKAITKDVKIAMSNTFGFGGHNAIVIFKKFEG